MDLDAIDTFKAQGDVGLTARWGMTSNLVLGAAANPDSSQVEADVAQLDVNTRFALFFPEKRPFFLEGLDFFTTPLLAVFTRTVADPAGGIKLTGKAGRNAVGVFVTRDRLNNLILPSNEASVSASTPDPVTGAVVRYRRDVGSQSTVGFLYAGRESRGYSNRVYGPDKFLRFSPSDTVNFQFLRSETSYPARIADGYGQKADLGGGYALQVGYQHIGRTWIWLGSYEDRDPEFRGDSGFIPRVDVRTTEVEVQRRFWGSASSWFTRASVGVRGLRTTDHSGRLTDQIGALYVAYQGPFQSEAFGNIRLDKETYQGSPTASDATCSTSPSSRAGRSNWGCQARSATTSTWPTRGRRRSSGSAPRSSGRWERRSTCRSPIRSSGCRSTAGGSTRPT